LGKNEIGDANIQELVTALKKTKTLVSLELDSNQLTDAAGTQILESLKGNKVTGVHSAGNQMKDEVVNAMTADRFKTA